MTGSASGLESRLKPRPSSPSIQREAYAGGVWLALFKVVGQVVSWTSTIVIARVLAPNDYGLMAMATIITGYMALFCEMGLGSAIVYREKITQEELSSVFWFTMFWGFLLAGACLLLAYPTAHLFEEPRIVPVTQTVALVYVLAAILVVPQNILRRDLKFKTYGFIEAVSVTVSCVAMLGIALLGGGVWALVAGHIILHACQLILYAFILRWTPGWCFSFAAIRPMMSYGLKIAGGRTLHYINTMSDSFFGGRALGAHLLGFYSLALQLAAIPNDKIISLVNSVAFSVFSRCQNDPDEFKDFFLKLVNVIALITFPVFVGAVLVADSLIPILLGEKWRPAVIPFKILCLSQLLVAVTTPNSVANNAKGRPQIGLYFGLVSVQLLPVSFYVAAQYGLNALAIPWITIAPVTRLAFIAVTLRVLEISFAEYLRSLRHPLIATALMVVAVWSAELACAPLRDVAGAVSGPWMVLLSMIAAGVLSYGLYMLRFEKETLVTLLNARRRTACPRESRA